MGNDIHCPGETKKEFVAQKLVLDKAADKAGIVDDAEVLSLGSSKMVPSSNST